MTSPAHDSRDDTEVEGVGTWRRPAPDRDLAAGMLAGIQAQRAREGHGPAPYDLLDLDSETDRRIIASVYALMAREGVEEMAARLG